MMTTRQQEHLKMGIRDVTSRYMEAIVRTTDIYTERTEKIDTIGNHIRHVIEFFQQFESALKSDDDINFDERQRDYELSTNPETAYIVLGELRENLLDIVEEFSPTHSVRLTFSLGRGPEGEDDATVTAYADVGVMLYYLHEHGMHHLPLIIEVAHQHGISFDDGFDLAASTERFKKAQQLKS